MFGTGSDGPDLVDREHHPAWIGRPIDDPGVRLGGRIAVRIERKGELKRVSRGSGFVPVLLTGEVSQPVREASELVLTLNERVAAVVPVNPWWAGPPTFSALLPERLVREGANSVEAFWAK